MKLAHARIHVPKLQISFSQFAWYVDCTDGTGVSIYLGEFPTRKEARQFARELKAHWKYLTKLQNRRSK